MSNYQTCKALLKVIGGLLILIVAALIGIQFQSWGHALVELIKGSILLAIILTGIFFIIIGFSDLKS